jgi:hypothetical protein
MYQTLVFLGDHRQEPMRRQFRRTEWISGHISDRGLHPTKLQEVHQPEESFSNFKSYICRHIWTISNLTEFIVALFP